jgi:hypothetical protein
MSVRTSTVYSRSSALSSVTTVYKPVRSAAALSRAPLTQHVQPNSGAEKEVVGFVAAGAMAVAAGLAMAA